MSKNLLLALVFFGLYGGLITLNALEKMPLSWWSVLIQGTALAIMDFRLHAATHANKLDPPGRTMAWVLIAMVLAAHPGFRHGWQVSVIWFCQGWWDSSWHAADYHRPNGLPQAASDHAWVRWAAPTISIVTLAIPFLLS